MNGQLREGRHAPGMHLPLRQPILDEVLRVIVLVRPLAAAIGRRDRNLASQVRRALSSVALNLSEGFGSSSGNAGLRFECALGSLYETKAGLRVAVAWGYLSSEAAAPALEALGRLGGRIFGLVRR